MSILSSSLWKLLFFILIFPLNIQAAEKAIDISIPYNPANLMPPAGTDHHRAGYWNSFVRGNRFNMYTESVTDSYVVDTKGLKATLIIGIRADGPTNMRITIWTTKEPPQEYPELSEVVVKAGNESLTLESQNSTDVRIVGFGYQYDFTSKDPSMLSKIRRLMQNNAFVTFLLGDGQFETKFSMDGFSNVADLVEEWHNSLNN